MPGLDGAANVLMEIFEFLGGYPQLLVVPAADHLHRIARGLPHSWLNSFTWNFLAILSR